MQRCTLVLLLTLVSLSSSLSQSRITFILEDVPLGKYQKVGLRGSTAPLSWDKSIPLLKVGNVYQTVLDFAPSAEELEFKFVLYNQDRNPEWEGIQNRSLSLPENSSQISQNRWNVDQIIDLSTLKPIPSEDLMKDFELIKTMVLEVHPGTYRYNRPEEIQAALEELKTTFSRPLRQGEAYLAISKLTAQLKCDHTRAGYNNQNRIINSIIHFQKDKIPFTFQWVEDQMLLIHNASENKQLKKGTIVQSINGVPVREIRAALLPYIGADGKKNHNRIYKTEVNGYDFRYNAFDIFFPLLFPLKEAKLKLVIHPPGESQSQEIEVSCLSRDERFARLSSRYPEFPKTRDDLWTFKIINAQVALLQINSFGLMGWKAMQLDYKQFLADVFQELKTKAIPHLIIDIRKNTGGNDEMADELFSYLSKSSFNYAREGRMRYLNFPENLKAFTQTWGNDPWYYNPQPEDRNPQNGYYIFKENFSQSAQKSRKNQFQGKLFMLCSHANTSLAFYTAARFQMQQLGLLIGQETGGNRNDINGGQILFLRLPHSKIEIDFPVMGAFSLQPQADEGISPDIKVNYRIQDVIAGKDLEVEKVLELIKKE